MRQASTRLVKPARPAAGEQLPLGRTIETVFAKSGYLSPQRQAEMDEAARRREDRDREIRVEQLRAASTVFPRFAEAHLESLDFARERLSGEEFDAYVGVRNELRTLVDNPGTVVLSGDNGTGKSHLASALVNAFTLRVRTARYVRAIDFFRALKSTFGQPGRTAEELINAFTGYDLVVIDEIDVRSDSKWENDELRSLLDARYGHQVSTVLITNRTKAEINGDGVAAPYLSRALRDRIRQEGGILECGWKSLRGEANR